MLRKEVSEFCARGTSIRTEGVYKQKGYVKYLDQGCHVHRNVMSYSYKPGTTEVQKTGDTLNL